MTLDQLITIKKAAEVTGTDPNLLGTAVMYNLMITSVRNQHVINFKSFLYFKVKGVLNDCQHKVPLGYKGKVLYKQSPIPEENPWDNLITLAPGTEQELQETSKRIKNVDSDGYVASEHKPVMVTESTPGTGSSLVERVFDAIKGLF